MTESALSELRAIPAVVSSEDGYIQKQNGPDATIPPLVDFNDSSGHS
jgi:hypothetical protein